MATLDQNTTAHSTLLMPGMLGCTDPESGCVCLDTTVVQSLDAGHYPCKDLNTVPLTERFSFNPSHVFVISTTTRNFQGQE